MGSGTSRPGTPVSTSGQRQHHPPRQPAAQSSSDVLDSVESQVMLSYRVPETGAEELGGDGTVIRMKTFLEAKGYSVFVGESALQGGQKWSQRIQQAVVNCQVFIALCSPSYGQSEWTFREFQLADNRHKPILPIWHSGPYPPPALEIFLSGMQRVPQGNKPLVQTDHAECMQQVLACLRRMSCLPKQFGRANVAASSQQPQPQPQAPPNSAPKFQPPPPCLPLYPSPLFLQQQQQQQQTKQGYPYPSSLSYSPPLPQQQQQQPKQGYPPPPYPPYPPPSSQQPQSKLQHQVSPPQPQQQAQPQKLEVAPGIVVIRQSDVPALLHAIANNKGPADKDSARLETLKKSLHESCFRGGSVRDVLSQVKDTRSFLESARTPAGVTPLMMAASRGCTAIVKELLAAGADVDAADKDGQTALMSAAGAYANDVVKAMLDGLDEEGAVSTGSQMYYDTVVALVRAGANTRAVDKNGKTALDHGQKLDRMRNLLR